MKASINYFTDREQAFSIVGSLTRFEGTLVTSEPNMVLEGSTLRFDGTKQRTWVGRFIFDDAGNLFYAAARKKNFVRITGKFDSLLVAKAGA